MAQNIKTGTGHQNVIEAIENAEDHIYISSPWISQQYAEILTEKNNDAYVELHTSNDTRNKYHKKSLETLTEQEETDTEPVSSKAGLATGTVGLLIGMASTLQPIPTSAVYVGAALVISAAIFILHGMYTQSHRWTPTIDELHIYEHSPYEKLHSKIYIIDGEAYTGSLNFTQTAVQRNVETVVHLTDQAHVQELQQQLQEIQLEKDTIPNVAESVRVKDKQETKNLLNPF